MDFSLAIWVSVCIAKVLAFLTTFRRSSSRSLVCVRLFLMVSIGAELAIWLSLHVYGYTSVQYKYTYFASDSICVLTGYFVLLRLVEIAFQRTSLRIGGLRAVAMLLFSGVATCSAFILFQMHALFKIKAVSIELGQNFGFLGMVLTFLLWIGMNVLHVPGLRFRRVVLAFSTLYSSGAIAYSLAGLFRSVVIISFMAQLAPLMAICLLAYALYSPEPMIVPRSHEPQVLMRGAA